VKRLADAIAQAVIHDATDTEFAPAKVNLALHVTGQRPDGYHLLDTLVVFADIGDMMSVAPAESGITLDLEGPFSAELSLMAKASGNLALDAARALAARAGRRRLPAAGMMLTKRIPLASGLGGGSADAAAALRLLNRYWAIDLPLRDLAEIGVSLGADVPMCLYGRPATARGIGERLTPVEGMPALPMVLVNPAIPLPTARVFGNLKNKNREPLPELPRRFSSVISFVQWLRTTRNDLTDAARVETGLPEQATKALAKDEECLIARMSGSGATAFGIFANRHAAERAAERLRAKHPHWWVMPAMTGAS
jgi:4-diphosphocytidyl-2-C-methyl-D-erythritol kinase